MACGVVRRGGGFGVEAFGGSTLDGSSFSQKEGTGGFRRGAAGVKEKRGEECGETF